MGDPGPSLLREGYLATRATPTISTRSSTRTRSHHGTRPVLAPLWYALAQARLRLLLELMNGSPFGLTPC